MKDLKRTTVAGNISTNRSQAPMWHQELVTPRHVVSMVKINLKPQARAPVVLWSSDMAFSDDQRIDDDSRRLQLALHFRDAKHYGGWRT